MREARGNLWKLDSDLVVITTNGFVKNNGEAVMGRGCALEARQQYPNLPAQLGERLTRFGNHVHVFLLPDDYWLATFPVKHNWFERADPELIWRSAYELVDQVSAGNFKQVVLPRPGCGNGLLRWEDIRHRLDEILDDRFTVVTF